MNKILVLRGKKEKILKKIILLKGWIYSHFKCEVSHPEFTLIHKFITNPSNPDCEDLYDGHHLETSGNF